MNKKIKLEKCTTRPNLVELWKYNKKGYYNFIEYIEKPTLQQIQKRFRGYQIIDKQECLEQN